MLTLWFLSKRFKISIITMDKDFERAKNEIEVIDT